MASIFETPDDPQSPSQSVLRIREHLEDKNVDHNDTVLFECGTIGNVTRFTWYKDGNVIKNNEKTKIISSRTWHTMQIDSASVNDSGVYVFVAFNDTTSTYTHATLFVGPSNGNGVLYYLPSQTRHLRINSPLVPVRVAVGEEIKLTVTIDAVAFEYHWGKSNGPIERSGRLEIYDDPYRTELAIKQAQLTDSGIYYIVIYTSVGNATAMTNVIVYDCENLTYCNSRVVPAVEEALPDEVEFVSDDHRVIMCKANIDQHTTIEWLKDDAIIGPMHSLKTECIYEGNLGVSFLNVSESDSGEYSLVLKNSRTGTIDTTNCLVTVAPREAVNAPEPPLLLRPLQSALACVGARIIFECRFDLQSRHQYYFVVWYVGIRRVERTNNIFSVISNKGNFSLAIKYVDPTMNGDVTCELRRATLRRKSVIVCRSSAQLAVAPYYIFDINESTKRVIEYKVLKETLRQPCTSKTISNKDGRYDDARFVNAVHLRMQGQRSSCKPIPCTEVFEMDIKYCRLDEDGYYFMEVKNYGSEISSPRAVVDDDEESSNNDGEKVIVLEWESCSNIQGYRVSMLQSDGLFYEAGVVTHPHFTLRHSETEKTYTFRICAMIIPEENSYDLSVVPVDPKCPPEYSNHVVSKAVTCFPVTFDEFGDILGSGAFGQVLLVHNEHGEYFAAKMIRTMTEKKRTHAAREYELLRGMQHPKVVSLHDAFYNKDIYVLVMEYLWGGELFERLVEEDQLTEADVINYVRQITDGLRYVHACRIVHLDIKPENIVCISPNSRQIKIIDFGLARGIGKRARVHCVYGTRDYVAPEMLNYEQMSIACDMWSLGVVTYMLLSGTLPFRGSSWPERCANITSCNYTYDDAAFDYISFVALNFVDNLLVLDVNERMTAAEAMEHNWLAHGPSQRHHARMTIAKANMKEFLMACKNKWQCAGTVVRAACRLRHMRTHDESAPSRDHTYTVAEQPGD